MAAPTITILSATQRTDGSFLVDIDFEVSDTDLDNLTINLSEYSDDGGSGFNAASAQTFDRQHTAVSPLTGITGTPQTFRFVWNAFQDLIEDDFSDIHFKIEVDDGTTAVSDTLTGIEVNTLTPITEGQIQQNRLNRRKLVDRLPTDFFGFGLVAPFVRGSSDFRAAGGVEQLRSRIRQILNTRGISVNGTLGELPWRPDFGTAKEELRHQPNDDILAELAFITISRAIDINEPMVELRSVEAERKDTTLTLRMSFSVVGSNRLDNLVFSDDNKFILEVGL